MAGVTITGNNPGDIGGSSGQGQFPAVFLPPLIELAKQFPTGEEGGFAWSVAHFLTLVRCSVAASSVDAGSLELTARYGVKVKMPYDSDYFEYAAGELAGWWVRFSIVPQGGGAPIRQFVGIIDNQPRTLTGSSLHPSGTQNFVARGGLKIIERLSISQSIFYDPDADTFATIGFIPAMNRRDARGLLVGNRNDDPTSNADGAGGAGNNFCYGGKTLWSHLDYLYYLITNFIQQRDDGGAPVGPAWTVMGATNILDGIQTTVEFGESETAAAALKKLIDPKYGVDFCVVPTPAGFAVNIFSIADRDISFAGAKMPGNTPPITIYRDTQINLVETHVVSTTERKFDKIKVIGKRVVVCGTLWGAGLSSGDLPDNAMPSAEPRMPPNPPVTLPATLVARWSTSIEADYKAGGTAIELDKKDLYRKNEKYREVYQHLGAPDDWDLDGGTWAVGTKGDGSLTTGDYQTVVRDTLHYLPFRQGYDYASITTKTDKNSGDVTIVTAADNTDGSVESEISPGPLAWIYDEQANLSSSQQYVTCHDAGIGVANPHLDWGVQLEAAPNHRLALDSWSLSQVNSTTKPPEFNYKSAVATIAIESDHRLALEYDVPAAQAAGDGSVMTIIDNSAELWVVLPGTIVGLNDKGDLVKFGQNGTPPKTPVIMRSDVPRLVLAMCGAIARYSLTRAKAQYAAMGHLPWASLLGRTLIVTQKYDVIQPVACVVTSIEWEMGVAAGGDGPKTIVKTGYA